jgi:hypothetical protein
MENSVKMDDAAEFSKDPRRWAALIKKNDPKRWAAIVKVQRLKVQHTELEARVKSCKSDLLPIDH